jgi:hypothetical protein
MNAVCANGKRNVHTIVDNQPNATTQRNGHRLFRLFVKLQCRKLLFAKLDQRRSPGTEAPRLFRV